MSKQEKDDIKRELSTLSCPFTWELEDAVNYYMTTQKLYRNIENDDVYDKDCVFLQKLIELLVIVYEKVLYAEVDCANMKLEKCEELLMEMKNKDEDEDIMRVIEHIFNSTKCHYLLETNNIEELKIILPTIVKISDFSNIELAALTGCKSVVWSMYTDYGRIKAMDLAEQAIKEKSDKALWHFILARNARRERRLTNFFSPPSEKEKLHFKIAYEKSSNPIYGIYLAQMYRECTFDMNTLERKNFEQSMITLYKELLRSNENNFNILLKLALCFIHIQSSCQAELAKYCLDAAEKINPDDGTYFHYRAIYFKKIGDIEKALEFYKKAGEIYNYPADLDYIRLGWKSKSLDPLTHLQSMLLKYDKYENERMQEICLHIATCYYQKKDLEHAMEYYLKAIMINPKSKRLKTKYAFLNFQTKETGGIYAFLKFSFLRIAKNCEKYRCKDQTFIEAYNKLQNFCDLYGETLHTR